MRVQTGDNIGIGGFIITGSSPKRVLVLVLGPSLAQFNLSDFLADPVLELRGPSTFTTVSNDAWRDDPAQKAQIEATGLAPKHDDESAIIITLPPGSYTALASGKNNTSGLAVIEVYDLAHAVPSKLANISTRALVGTGDNIVIAGFTLGSNSGADRVAVRGLGPSLAAAHVSNPLANPVLELRNIQGALILANDDWQDDPDQATELSAAKLVPEDKLESALIKTLPPGAYTAFLKGLDNGTGVGLIEVYDLGP
jgi:hypothetical protein